MRLIDIALCILLCQLNRTHAEVFVLGAKGTVASCFVLVIFFRFFEHFTFRALFLMDTLLVPMPDVGDTIVVRFFGLKLGRVLHKNNEVYTVQYKHAIRALRPSTSNFLVI